MEKLYISTVNIKDSLAEVEKVLIARYQLTNNNLKTSLKVLDDYLQQLRSEIFVVLEHPYVDKTYRDTYYNYFASKKDDYSRNSIRLSFFKIQITDELYRSSNEKDINLVRENYLGFLVVRPTFPYVIGRSLIDPIAFQTDEIKICRTDYNSTVNGLKLKISGFPHSSQDSETITCAETTIWSVMEYFGNKYAEYSPILPSKVNEILGRFAFERLIPSKGLTAAQISYALREIGFGVKIYSSNSYKSDFFSLLRTYVESGIPVVGIIQNSKGIGHALNIIGRKNIDNALIAGLSRNKTITGNVNIFDFSDLDLEYVYVDDNYPPYRTSKLSIPANYYNDPKWSGCSITNFIVPLYPKIYLEAGEARKMAITLIEALGLVTNKDILIKTFLASSRSFKNSLSLNSSLQADAKELLINTPMPKFIWVTELSDKTLILKDFANGMLILDATEPKRAGIIAALIEGFYISNDLTTFAKITLPLHPFSMYNNNLK
jgi:hypothetical protein